MHSIRNPYALAILVYLLAMQKRRRYLRKDEIMIHFNINEFVCKDSINHLHYMGYISINRAQNSYDNKYFAFERPQMFYPTKEGI
jgi:hypothetical protein